MPDFVIAQGNLPTLNDTLCGSINLGPNSCGGNGGPAQALDLTNCTVQFVFQDLAGSMATCTGNAQILNASAGQVAYTFTAGQTDTPGRYQAQWKITFPNGQILNLP
ncbi:MAG TPA: BppU family phage baseplate upper protein, partial [Verrucomicrobiae bacterium]|nr:BppU family phage baseplate upper protein [Verrucomicrobiae bacterium]